jgi:hypothetical protein
MLPVVLLPGKVISFEVKFSPADSGIVTSAVTIRSDDVDNPIKTVSLTGKGFALNLVFPGICYASIVPTGTTEAGLLTIDLATGAGRLKGVTGLNNISGFAINEVLVKS